MATEEVSKTVSYKEFERTRRVILDCTYTPGSLPDAYTATIEREVRRVDADGIDVQDPSYPEMYLLRLPDIATDTVTVGGVTLTILQLVGFIAAYCDQKVETLKAIQKSN